MTFDDWMRAERARGAGQFLPADGSMELRMLRRCWDAATAAAMPADGVRVSSTERAARLPFWRRS
jgi:hypothetical protein